MLETLVHIPPSISISAILVTSFLGSLHCAGMCGGFVVSYAGSSKGGIFAIPLHVAYNFGRLLTYSCLGALSGWIGSGVNNVGAMVGVQQVAGIVLGLILVAWAVLGFVSPTRKGAIGNRTAELFFRLAPFFRRTLANSAGRPPIVRAFSIGTLSTLLPCGWLYMYAAVAATSGSALGGIVIMFLFWLGTLPMMLAVGGLSRVLAAKLGKIAPIFAGLSCLVIGILSIFGHFEGVTGGSGAHCSHHSSTMK